MKFQLLARGLYKWQDPRDILAFARAAEQLGFESFDVGDHVVVPDQTSSAFPYSADGKGGPHYPSHPYHDPWTMLAYVAAATERIRLSTGIYILPMRKPMLTAKTVATVDLLSQGRVTMGIGVGWIKEEFEAIGEPFERRGKRTDEIIGIVRRLWTEDTVEHHGEFYSFGPVKMTPKPVQRPIPIHYGGISAAAIQHAATLCDGWITVPGIWGQKDIFETLEDTKRQIANMTEQRKRAGRDHLPFEITGRIPMQATLDDLRRREEAGMTRFRVVPWGSAYDIPALPGAIESLERFAATYLQRV